MSTIPISDKSLSLSTVKSILYKSDLIDNLDTPLSLKQFSNGYSNLTYLLTTPENEFVLRRPPAGAIKRGHDMGREYKVLSNLSNHFNKAPKPYYYEDDIEVLGAPFYIMEKISGVVLTYQEAKDRKLDANACKTISESWLNTLVDFHRLDYKAVGLSDLGKPKGYVQRQVSNWSKQYFNAASQELDTADFVIKWMSENQPKKYEFSLIHNDYKYDNLVFKEDKWDKINAILDWEMCTIGDPLMDLGTSLGYWVMANDGPIFNQTIPSPTVFPGNPSREEIVQAYSERSGRAIDHLIFYYVFGLFKIAIIAQQIFYRYDKGLTSNKKFAQLDKVCAFLCQTAKQAIQKQKIIDLY